MSVASVAQLAPEQSQRAVPSKSKPETVVVLLFTLLIAALAVGGAASLLRLLYPVLGTLVAGYLYFRSKPQYVSFVVWIWFLSAFVRRMADFHGGFQETSLILLTPYLATAVSGLLVLREPRKLAQKHNAAIFLALVAIAYGFGVGLTKYSVLQMAPALLNWVVPPCFAYLLIECRSEFSEISQSVKSSFIFGALIMGAYSIFQFFILPPWDRQWLENMRTTTFGVAEPTQLRAFSTMNAPVVYGLTCMALLLLVLGSASRLRAPAGVFGLAGLLLALNRSAWLGFAAGVAFIIVRLPNRDRVRILGALLMFLSAGSVLFVIPQTSLIVSDKFRTFTTPSDDTSAQARSEGYSNAFNTLLHEPFGEGLGSPDLDHKTLENDDAIGPHDSVLLELLYSLGWFGTVCYGSALILILRPIFTRRKGGNGRFTVCIQSILIAFIAQSLLNDIVYGGVGVFFWIAAGLEISEQQLFTETNQARQSLMTFA